MTYSQRSVGRVINLELEGEEELLSEVQRVVDREGVKDGFFSSGLGGFQSFGIRSAGLQEDTILQLSSLQGFVIDGRVRLFGTVSIENAMGAETLSGEAEGCCKKLFYCQLLLAEII